MFAWQASDIPCVPREVIEHHLAVCPHARPVKQKVGDPETGSSGFGKRSAPSNVVGQSGGSAQGKWEVEVVY